MGTHSGGVRGESALRFVRKKGFEPLRELVPQEPESGEPGPRSNSFAHLVMVTWPVRATYGRVGEPIGGSPPKRKQPKIGPLRLGSQPPLVSELGGFDSLGRLTLSTVEG